MFNMNYNKELQEYIECDGYMQENILETIYRYDTLLNQKEQQLILNYYSTFILYNVFGEKLEFSTLNNFVQKFNEETTIIVFEQFFYEKELIQDILPTLEKLFQTKIYRGCFDPENVQLNFQRTYALVGSTFYPITMARRMMKNQIAARQKKLEVYNSLLQD